MGAVRYEGVFKQFGRVPVIEDVNLNIREGELVVFVGPSGCGKTTLLRLLAGLESITRGELYIGRRRVTHTAPRDRNVAMVFQNYALYPHMTVAQNIGFGLKLAKVPKKERRDAVERAAGMLGLSELLDRRPRELSGGQRQRVAMGRAIVRNPSVFLMDEPLSNLDAKLRNHMRVEIKQLQRQLGTTMIYVTHDQVEAMTLANRIAVLHNGRVAQFGTPDELYACPANVFVAGFIGTPAMNFIRADQVAQWGLVLPGGVEMPMPTQRTASLDGNGVRCLVGIRPEHLELAPSASSEEIAGSSENKTNKVSWSTTVALCEPLGGEVMIHASLGDQPVRFCVPRRNMVPEGSAIRLSFDAAYAHVFTEKGDRCLSPAESV